jgi:2-methylcitrate dehydratase PrpD
MTVTTTGTTRELASLLSDLRFEALPREVVDRTEEFFLDWIASALVGRNAKPVRILEHFADDKTRRLAGFRAGASPEEIRQAIDRVWVLDRERDVRDLLAGV